MLKFNQNYCNMRRFSRTLPPRFTGLLIAVLFVAVISERPAAGQSGDLTGFSFLRLEPSARGAALAGSYSAIYGADINSLFYNPALLNEEMHGALSVSYLNHLSDVNAGFVAYGRNVGTLGLFAAGIRFLSWGSMERADEFGVRDGTFGAGDVALSLGYARAHDERIRYGASLHLVHSSIDNASAQAVAFDAGAVYHLPEQQFTVSASVHNLGTTLSSYGITKDQLPVDLRLSVAKRLEHFPLLFTITTYNLHDLSGSDDGIIGDVFRHVALGGEFYLGQALNLRIGYNHRKHEELKMKSRLDIAGVGMGFGVNLARFNLDYAYNSWSSIGGLHQFTVRTRI